VVNAHSGSRLETYAIPAERGSRTFCLNGAAARLGLAGDMITIMVFASMPEDEARDFVPRVIVLDKDNSVVTERNTVATA
jgi:aspartate 1-decarboxylase